MSRSVRKGWLSYDGWKGTAYDYRRERLLLDDIEREMFEDITAALPELRKDLLAIKMPWLNDSAETDDPDRLYKEVVKDVEE